MFQLFLLKVFYYFWYEFNYRLRVADLKDIVKVQASLVSLEPLLLPLVDLLHDLFQLLSIKFWLGKLWVSRDIRGSLRLLCINLDRSHRLSCLHNVWHLLSGRLIIHSLIVNFFIYSIILRIVLLNFLFLRGLCSWLQG